MIHGFGANRDSWIRLARYLTDSFRVNAFDLTVFIIWGKHDRVLDVSSVAEFEKIFPHSFSVIIEDAGHAPMVEKPKASAAHYLNYLKKSKR